MMSLQRFTLLLQTCLVYDSRTAFNVLLLPDHWNGMWSTDRIDGKIEGGERNLPEILLPDQPQNLERLEVE